MARIIYSKHYDIGLFGLERLHPFDSKKYGRAWKRLRRDFGNDLAKIHVCVDREVSAKELGFVHSLQYLEKLTDTEYVSRALEVTAIRHLPNWLIDRKILRPMRWATRGTILAAETALTTGLAINLSGGYHHAKPDAGEGFSIYSDIGIAIESLRAQHHIDADARVVYIDADAHQGNGVCHTFMNDPRVFIFDIFNCRKYPMFDVEARARIDCPIPITDSTSDAKYLSEIQSRLPGFLDSVDKGNVQLAIYNAGTDIFLGDPVGGLSISASAILKRDLLVVEELRKRNIPVVMVLSGGYTKVSYRLVSDSVAELVRTYH